MLTRYRYSSLREGLVGHWRPSRGATGNTLIDSVRGNHGTLTNGPTWQASDSGVALSFDGTDDYVSLPRNLQLEGLTQYAASVWVNTRALVTAREFVTYRSSTAVNPILLQIDSTSSDLRFIVRDNAGVISIATSTGTAVTGQWMHLVGMRNGNAISLFRNGINVANNTGTIGSITPNAFALGAAFTGTATPSFFADALIDDISIFTRTLTPSEILTLYTAGRGALDRRVNVPVVRGFASGMTATPTTATLTLTTFTPNVLTPQTVTPAAATLTAATFAPTVTATENQVATPTTTVLTLANFAPTVTASSASTPTPTPAQLTLTTFAPSVTATANVIATPAPATLALSSFAPAVSVASGAVTVTPMTASLTLTTFAPSLAAEVPPVWTITFTGHQYCSGDLSVPKTSADLVVSKTQGDLIVKD